MPAVLNRWWSPPRSIILTVLIISFLLGQYNISANEQLTPEERCGYQPGQFDKLVANKDAIEVTVWARATGGRCWRAFLPFEAAKLVLDYKILVRPWAWATGWDADADVILPAASKGEGPDIAYLGHDAIIQAYHLGYIEPIDVCLDRYPEFDDIRENAVLWSQLTSEGKRLGIPMEPSMRVFFFSKTKLSELGWSEDAIAQLPDKIRLGHFTLDDMATVAQQAVQAGVVQPGLGYWPDFRRRAKFLALYRAFGGDIRDAQAGQFRLSRTVLEQIYAFQHQLFVRNISSMSFAGQEVGTSYLNRNLYKDTVAHGKVLFWQREFNEWSADYAFSYVADLGGKEYLSQISGYALFPSGIHGQPASIQRTNLEAYVILSEKATGRQHQEAACAVLAKVMTPEIHSRFATSIGTLGVLESQDDPPAFVADRLARETRYFWDYLWQWPEPRDSPNSDLYVAVLDKYLAEVEVGRFSPEAAVEEAVRELKEQLGNAVMVEP
jgi:inositol-phosphate transport system substrate-binding protein